MMARKREPERPDPDSMRFEDAIEELEAIIDRIEQGEIGLEESLAERRRGEALIRRGRSILDAADQELEQVMPADREADDSPDGEAADAADRVAGDGEDPETP